VLLVFFVLLPIKMNISLKLMVKILVLKISLNVNGDFLKVSGIKDNLKLRHDFLEALIDETILLLYANSSGFVNKPGVYNCSEY